MVKRSLRGAMALAVAATGLAACSSGGGVPALTWYINPDNGGQDRLAAACSQASGGQFKIKTSLLPSDASQQREQLIRRLAAKDSSIDLMSLDPPFVAEAANAGFLRAYSPAESSTLTSGVFPAAVQNAQWKGRLYGAPFWANTQLLWYRKSAMAKAGVDPTAADFTWDKMIDAAVRGGVTVGEQGNKYEGYMVWINALVVSAGGQIISNADKGKDATVGLDTPAGKEAARIIAKLARSKAASPTFSTDIEEQSRAEFNGPHGGFMLNWAYVWLADGDDAKAGVIGKNIPSDIGWARYPQVVAGQPSKPPFGGIELGIGAYTRHSAQAVRAVACITSAGNMKKYMIDSGNPAARPAIYDDPAVRQKFPMASLIRDSINAAQPRPITPFYPDVSSSVQNIFHPPASVNPATTPGAAQRFIPKVLHDKRLL